MIKTKANIAKTILLIMLLPSIQIVHAAFTLSTLSGERAKISKYSLKNLSALSHKTLSLSSLKATMQFKGILTNSVNETSTGLEFNSMLRYNNGNSTVIYPYRFNVKTYRFKTPSPQR